MVNKGKRIDVGDYVTGYLIEYDAKFVLNGILYAASAYIIS